MNINEMQKSKNLKYILRHELDLKWIKRLHTPFQLGFNNNIYHDGNISKMPDFDVFFLLDIKNRTKLYHGKAKMGILNDNIKLSNSFRFKYPLKFWTSSNVF